MKRLIFKTIRNTLLAVIVPLLLFGLVYVGIAFQYKDRFYPGTWINGTDFSGKTVDEARERMKVYRPYQLRIFETGGNQEVINGAEIDYTLTYDDVAYIKEQQGMWTWIFFMTGTRYHDVEAKNAFDEDKLKEQVMALDCVQGKGVIRPKDARIDYRSDGVHVTEEVYGTLVDGERLYDLIYPVVEAGLSRIYVADEDIYVQPAVTLDDPAMQRELRQIDKLTQTTVTYMFDDDEIVLDSETLGRWIRKGDDGAVTLDADAIETFVAGLAAKYNTLGNSREFVTTSGDTVTVAGGNYGWEIDQAAELEALTNLLMNGISETREPVYTTRAAVHKGNEIGGTYIEVSIDQQHLWFYKDGKLFLDTNVVTANVSQNYATPRGSFKVLNKITNTVLKGKNRDGSDYESPVSYWLGFYGSAFGFHDASWRGDYQGAYGGTIYYYNGSHGCINTPYSWMKQLYEAVEVGTPVMIY